MLRVIFCDWRRDGFCWNVEGVVLWEFFLFLACSVIIEGMGEWRGE